MGAAFPKTQVQLCIVHRVRNSLGFVLHGKIDNLS
ncbi:MAG: hypothetical protein WC856_09455 [Methylococcaceae bacterium]